MEAVADATLSVTKGVRKTIVHRSRDVARLADELSEFSDIDDIFKSVEDHSEKGMTAINLQAQTNRFLEIFLVF